jgi:hypothetical protein
LPAALVQEARMADDPLRSNPPSDPAGNPVRRARAMVEAEVPLPGAAPAGTGTGANWKPMSRRRRASGPAPAPGKIRSPGTIDLSAD